MLISPSLNEFVDWTKVVSVLGIAPKKAILPCMLPCPVEGCHGQITLYHDEHGGGAWAYCTTCKFAGDMLELAAAHWKGLDIPTTIQKLLASGVSLPQERILPRNLSTYMDLHIDRRRRLHALWEAARRHLPIDDSKVLRSLQHKLGLRLGLDHERWLTGPGLFVGGISRKDIEAAFRPLTQTAAHGLQNIGNDRIFVGQGWTDVLVIPCYDMPGHHKGFIFIGRGGELPKDMVIRIVRYGGKSYRDKFTYSYIPLEDDIGLALYDSLAYADDTVFVMDDPVLALKMQCWHLQDSGRPAPVVSIINSLQYKTSPSVWGQIKQQPIFWGRPSAALFGHARAANGKICLAGFNPDGPMKSFARDPLNVWLPRVQTEARPWEAVLEEQLLALPTAKAETILLNMGLPVAERRTFLARAPEVLQEHMEICNRELRPIKVIQYNGNLIREEESGWYNEKTGECICGAVLRIERVVYHKSGEIDYAGRILFGGTAYSFYERAATIEACPLQWMRDRLIKEKAGFLEYMKRWEPAIIVLATKFCTPEIIHGIDVVGWNGEAACFVFPNYIIDKSGNFVSEQGLKRHKPHTPAIAAPDKPILTGEEVQELEQAPVFWVVTACVARNILAPLFGAAPLTIGVVGSELQKATHAVAVGLGCVDYVVPPEFMQTKDERLSDIVNTHGWPVFLRPPKHNLGDWITWLNDPDSKNCIAPVDWYAGRAFAMKPGWCILEAGDCASLRTWRAAAKVLPLFLQYVARQRFKLSIYPEKSPVLSTLLSLEEWFNTVGGLVPVDDALQMLLVDNAPGRKVAIVPFIDLLCRLYHDGKLSLERAGYIKAGKPIQAVIYFPGDNGNDQIFIPKLVINQLLAAYKAPPLEVTAVTQAVLEADGCEHQYAGLSGWMIPEALWNRHLEAWHNQQKSKLCVIE